MDNYTIRGLREEAAAAGRPPKPLVSLRPQDSLHAVIGKLFRSRCSMAPVLSCGEGAPLVPPRPASAEAPCTCRSAAHAGGGQGVERACCCEMWPWPVLALVAVRLPRGDYVHQTRHLRTMLRQSAAERRCTFSRAWTSVPAWHIWQPGVAQAAGPGPQTLGLRPCAGGEACTLLHIATISGALACLMRHFRASLASLPLLAQPISALPVGTWSPDSPHAQAEPAANGAPQARTPRPMQGSCGDAGFSAEGSEVHGPGQACGRERSRDRACRCRTRPIR